MTERKKFFYNATLLTIVALTIKTVNLAFSAFISRKIGAEALGLYTLIGTIYAFAVTFATSGINLTVTRLVASAVGEGKKGEIQRIMKHSFLYALIFSGFASIVLFSFSPYFATVVLKDARAEAPLKALALSLIPIAFSAVFSGFFIGVKKIVRSSLVQVASQIFRISITVILIIKASERGVAEATLALCVATTLGELFSFLFAFFQYVTAKKPQPYEKSESEFSHVTSVALPLAFSAYIRLKSSATFLLTICLSISTGISVPSAKNSSPVSAESFSAGQAKNSFRRFTHSQLKTSTAKFTSITAFRIHPDVMNTTTFQP